MPQPILWRGTQALVEQPTSPSWRLGEKVTATAVYKGPFSLCLTSAPTRGTVGTGTFAGMIVSESSVTKERGQIGTVTIVWEGPNAPGGGQTSVPPDELSIELERFERPLQSHPRYATVTESLRTDIKTLLETAEDHTSHGPAKTRVQALPRANELYTKLKDGKTHYLIYFPTYQLTLHYATPPVNLTVGGFRQDPLPGPVDPPTGTALGTLGWLRAGDKLAFNGTYWQVTSTWISGPDIDPEIYP